MQVLRKFLLVYVLLLPAAAHAQALDVEAVNASTPTQCAETDNVYVKFSSNKVRRFTVEASHPVYLANMPFDSREPDFTNCEKQISPAADFKFTPRTVTLHDAGSWKLVGITYPNFWRPDQVPVTVGKRTETGLHLLQLWTRGRGRAEEVLVLYPADGYWRARPLAPEKLQWKVDPLLPTAYGSSFMLGPIADRQRPYAEIKDVNFDPATAIFRLNFRSGTAASVRVASLSRERISLDVILDKAVSGPFAALRSMYVSTENADVSWLEWRADGKSASAAVSDFRKASVTEFWAGRRIPSRHNASAPDMKFRDFRE